MRHQQLHDPTGNSKKRKLELKNGRAKRVHMVNGQKVEVLPSDDHDLVEDIDEPGELVLDTGIGILKINRYLAFFASVRDRQSKTIYHKFTFRYGVRS